MGSIENCMVAIIVLNWNGYEFTRKCLLSLSRVKSDHYQIVLVDNASTDNSIPRLKEEFDKPKYLINEKNLGFTGGNNVGIRYALEAGFEYVMLLNNDTEVKPDFLAILLNTISQNPKLGAVQPLIYFLNNRIEVWNAGGKFNVWTGGSLPITKIPASMDPYCTDWITGCCILVRSSLIKQIGLLNDKYFAYFEDVDWSLRMREKGFDLVVVPSSVIYHEAGAASKAKRKTKEGVLSPMVHYLNTRNQFFQVRNHVKGIQIIFAWPYQMMKITLFAIYFLIRARRKKLNAILKGFSDGVQKNCKDPNSRLTI